MEITNVRFGSDPEFLLRNKKTKELVSSIGIIPGSKEEPLRIPSLGHYYSIQVDNVLGEISVSPARTSDELWDNIQMALKYVNDNYLPEDVEIYHASSGTYTPEQLDNDIARLFGCDSSKNAWTYEDNEAPEAKDTLVRGAGTHIHISYNNPNSLTSFKIAQAFDIFCVLPTLFMDEDTNRREFYGKAGDCRLLNYGVECRQLGGFVLSDKSIYDYLMNNLLEAIKFLNEGGQIDSESAIKTQIAINAGAKELAEEVMKDFNIKLTDQTTKA